MPFTNRGKFSPENNGKLGDLISLGNWKQGIVNRVSEFNIPNDALLDALNVDIDNNGKIKRRKGYTKVISGSCHSLYTFGNYLYFVLDTNFVRMDKDANVETLINNYTTSPVNYVEVANELYFSTKSQSNKINKFNNVELWSIKSPQIQCEVTVGAENSGSLKKGKYRINYSLSYGNYETGIYPIDNVVDVPYDNFSIDVKSVPTSESTSANFYISSTNGEELYFAQSGYEVNIDFYDGLGNLPKLNSEAFPSLDNLTFSNGRIFGTLGSNIYFTNDRDYRQYNPMNYIGIDSTDIIILKAVDNGIYVVTELATYFLTLKNPEDSENMQLVKLYNYSAIKGTLFEYQKNVGWLSTEGYMVGDNTGNLQNLTKDKIDFSKDYTDGTSLIIKKDGIHQVIFSLKQDGEKTTFQTYTKDDIV